MKFDTPVHELYPAIQAEGSRAGRPTVIDMAEQVSPNLNKPVKVDYNNRFTGIGVQCESPVFETLPF